ncbi:MAG: SIMPL domain-containing protein [Oscillospiraceae bacterium]|nr:SIMPL domain-containing protein [Oscillospiraceae bacterium]
MGKIKTDGRVTLEFDAELYEISVTVRAEGETSGAAVTAGQQQTEALLAAFRDTLQINPEQISAEEESAEPPSLFQNSRAVYTFSRRLLLKIPADNRMREAVTELLAKTDSVTYAVTARLTDENRQKQLVLDAAVQTAREKAEKIAASLHCRVTGFEELSTGGMELSGPCAVPAAGMMLRDCKMNAAAELQNPKIRITEEVAAVWLTE